MGAPVLPLGDKHFDSVLACDRVYCGFNFNLLFVLHHDQFGHVSTCMPQAY